MSFQYFSQSRNICLILLFLGVAIADGVIVNPLNLPKPFDPEIQTAMLKMVEDAGYTIETHIVQTDDGYLLTIHRLPNEGGPPVFIQHGLLSSSADWLSLGKEKAFPYLLWNLGYDVWLGNYRGNAFSQGNVNLSSSDIEYWDFSWHEMGIYDLPAMISYVVTATSQKVAYVGHSMGTTGSFVMAALRPDMHDKVKVILSFAPVAIMKHAVSPLRILVPLTDGVEMVAKVFELGDLLSENQLTSVLLRYVCSNNLVTATLCSNLLFAIVGFDPTQIDLDQLTTIAGLTPAGSSVKCLLHYLQLASITKFRQYDYGAAENLIKYGALSPPEYDTSKMKIPFAFFYGDNDWLTAVVDVKTFYKKLPEGVLLQRINYTLFNHIDFLWARDAPKMLYAQAIEVIESYA
ncbi:lipase 3-like [Diachasmimorpha longicaudata]|uniref:lipase 3-like n=1 Tax=Diachasmimorpha longicaudata TaxID=58733 RepID=UPI0030B8CAEE